MKQHDTPADPELAALVARFAHQRVLVLGDMLADEYIIGRPVRLSREAPIPVLEWVDRYIVPGGATNLARNCRALGATVTVCGVIGDDPTGQALTGQLQADEVDTAGLVVEAGRPTATLIRVIGGGTQIVSQQIARIDRIVREPVLPATQEQLITFLTTALPNYDALVISDYEHGVLAPRVIAAALSLAREHGCTITVDAHGDLGRFQGITIATPNQDEAAASLGRGLRTDAELSAAGQALLDQMAAEAVLITRGSEGMTLVERNGTYQHLPTTVLSEVRDATGAGDTVSGVVTLALASGATFRLAAAIAKAAAGVVVRRLGAAVVTPGELLSALAGQQEEEG